MANPILKGHIDTSVKLGLGLLVVAVGAIAGGVLIGDQPGLIVSTVGTALLTIAALDLIRGPYQQDEMARDIRASLAIERSVIAAHLRDIKPTSELDISDLIGQSSAVSVLPWHPLYWSESGFRKLVKEATTRAISVRIYVPSPDTNAVAALSERLREGVDELTRSLKRLPDMLGNVWDEEGRHPDARLEILSYTGLPTFGMIHCAACSVIDLGPSVRNPPLDRTSHSFIFEPSAEIAEWLGHQLNFPGDEFPPATAGIRPAVLTPPRGGVPHPLAKPATEEPDDSPGRSSDMETENHA